MNRIDLRRFEFDYDTTWAAFFVDEKLNVYSRYGGRDERKPEGRMNKQSLLQTMREVLDVHNQRADATEQFGLPIVQPRSGPFKMPEQIPLLRASHQGCVHCHQIREYRLLQSYHDGNFTRNELFPYPLPKNIGITVDPKHGHRIQETVPDSSAAKAGLQAGDVIVGINKTPVHSEFDIRWALHHSRDDQPVSVIVLRGAESENAKVVTISLVVGADWRQTDTSWRRSMRSVPFPFAMRGYALTKSQRKEEGFKADELAIRIISIRGTGLGPNLKLKKRDVIVSIQGDSRHQTFDEFKSDLLRRYQPGDMVRMTVVRDAKRAIVSGTFPNWFIAENTVP